MIVVPKKGMEIGGLECRRRQLAELEALEAVYGFEGGFYVNEGEEEVLELLKAMVATAEEGGDESAFSEEDLPILHIRIEKTKGLSDEEKEEAHTLRLTMPRRYPAERALCTVEWQNGTRAQHEYINGTLAQLSASLADTAMESCYELVQKAQELIREELNDRREQRAAKTAIEVLLRLCMHV